jgi:hypothetical protein
MRCSLGQLPLWCYMPQSLWFYIRRINLIHGGCNYLLTPPGYFCRGDPKCF